MSKVVTKGTLLKLEIASVYTTIAQITKIDGPDAEVETQDTTCLDTSGVGREHTPNGLVEPGSVNWSLFWDPALAVHQSLHALLSAPVLKNWKKIYANTEELPFAATLTKLTPAVELGSFLTADCSCKLSGLATYPS